MNSFSIRDLEASDIPLIVGYWASMAPSDLKRMFIDPEKLPKSEQLTERLIRVLNTPFSERTVDPVIWEVDHRPIGLTNLNNIEKGNHAEIHLHIFDPTLRKKGYGRELFMQSVKKYFQRHSLKKIICQPASTNPAPNALMRKLGIPLKKTFTTTPSIICVEHEINHYEIEPL